MTLRYGLLPESPAADDAVPWADEHTPAIDSSQVQIDPVALYLDLECVIEQFESHALFLLWCCCLSRRDSIITDPGWRVNFFIYFKGIIE